MSIEAMKQWLEALELLVEERSSEAMDDGYAAITSLRQAIAEAERIKVLKEKTDQHDVDCLCRDCDEVSDLEDEFFSLDSVYPKPKIEQEQSLPPIEIGVDVTPDGTSVVGLYRRPDAVMEVFYSQFHPQPKAEKQCQYPNCDYPCMDLPDCQEQEPFGYVNRDEIVEHMGLVSCGTIYRHPAEGRLPLYTHPQPKVEQDLVCVCGAVWEGDELVDAPRSEPKREPLTDDQIYEMYNEPRSDAEMLAFARAIEAAHGIGAKK